MIRNAKNSTTCKPAGIITGIMTLMLLFYSAAPVQSLAKEGVESKKKTGQNRLKDEKEPVPASARG